MVRFCQGCLPHHDPNLNLEASIGPCACTCHKGGKVYGSLLDDELGWSDG